MSMSSSKAQQLSLRLAIALLCASAAAVHAPVAMAATATAPADSSAEGSDLDEVIVTGTRTTGLTAGESAAPIQILSSEALKAAAGSPDLMSTLAQIVPSLTKQAFGADMSGQTLQIKLRGLSPNDVLVLVDGKRRHTTANLAVDTGSVYQGGAGVDLNFIPVDAIDHIEVLTDGAAAQYGTDAIAGVINIVLKKNSSGGTLSGTYGKYMNGGGNTGDVSGNAGLSPSDNSYFNITGEINHHGHSDQGIADERVQNPANQTTYPGTNLPNVPGYPYLNQIFGDAETHTKLALINTGIKFDDGIEAYGFATYGNKTASSYENYRLPTKVVGSAALTAATGAALYPFPFGFSPQEATQEDDYSVTGGVKGTTYDWNWDVSSTYGKDRLSLYTTGSANAALYAATGNTPTDFYDGRLQSTQWTSNIDINRNFEVGLAGPLNVAFGGEYRRETYSIGDGVPASYEGGGAQSYPGFSPTDAGINSRKNYAGYVDLSVKPIEGLLIDAAGRYEHYSDFGSAKVGKLTARYDFTPAFALRGTINNGFRAPTLAEEFYSSTNVGPTTAFVQLPPNSAGGKLLGLGNGLEPEKSMNYSFGAVWRPIPGMIATLDLYQITITNRIVGSGEVLGYNKGTVVSPAVNSAIAANGNVLDPDVVNTGQTGIEVFANGIDTKTRGVDLSFAFPQDYDFGHISWTVGASYNDTYLTRLPTSPATLGGQPLYDATAQSDLTSANPKYVINLGGLYTNEKLSVNLVEKIYGPSSEYGNDDGDNGAPGPFPGTGSLQYYSTRIGMTPITNLDVGYQLTHYLKLSVGALNLLNRFPNHTNATQFAHENNFAYGDVNVAQYPAFSPFGINGGFYYAKATLSW